MVDADFKMLPVSALKDLDNEMIVSSDIPAGDFGTLGGMLVGWWAGGLVDCPMLELEGQPRELCDFTAIKCSLVNASLTGEHCCDLSY